MHPEWAPLGAARFLELVEIGEPFWKGARFFRVIEGMVILHRDGSGVRTARHSHYVFLYSFP